MRASITVPAKYVAVTDGQLPQVDAMLHRDDHLDIRTYRHVGSKGGRVLCIDVNGTTVLRIGGLKEIPQVVQE
jgi:hypothetical protein